MVVAEVAEEAAAAVAMVAAAVVAAAVEDLAAGLVESSVGEAEVTRISRISSDRSRELYLRFKNAEAKSGRNPDAVQIV